MLRHACGYALANRGHDTRALQAYLGRKKRAVAVAVQAVIVALACFLILIMTAALIVQFLPK